MEQTSKVESVSRRIIKKFSEAYILLKEYRNQAAIRKWIKICESHSRLMYKGLRRAKSIGERRHLEATIKLLNYFHNSLKSLLYVGGGLRKGSRSKLIVWKDITSAFKGRIRTSVVQNLGYKEPELFLKDAEKMTVRRLRNILRKFNIINMNMVLCCEFKKLSNGEEIFEYKYLSTPNKVADHGTNLNELIGIINKELLASLDEFQERDSGWALKEIINLGVNINKHSPLSGSSYMELPPQIKRKHACININNNDNACFAWSVVSALYPVDRNQHPYRITSYPHYSTVLNLDGIEFPVRIKDISKFERNNNININVYTLLKKKKDYEVVPVRLSRKKGENHINLLMFNEFNDEFREGEEDDDDDCEENSLNYHYCWIKNLSRLVSTQLSKRRCKKWICDRCLHFFYTEEKLRNHIADCEEITECKTVLPSDDEKWISFKNYNYKQRCPFIVYADLESILHSIREKENNLNSERYQQHQAHSIGYYFLCSYNSELNFYRAYRGSDCQAWFAKELQKLAEDVDVALMSNIPMEKLSSAQFLELNSQSQCHISEKQFITDDIRVVDHCSNSK